MGKSIPLTLPSGLTLKHVDAFPVDASGLWTFRLHFPEGMVEIEVDLSIFQFKIQQALSKQRKEMLT